LHLKISVLHLKIFVLFIGKSVQELGGRTSLLKGLTYGVMKYFQKHELTEKYKISEKGMKENLVAAINIKMDAPVFSGCVKNKLANPEIIESIANYVAELLFKKIEKDEKATERLIRKFEI
jgi:DNA gyrase/topoisomerase IV subunit B